MKKEIINVRLIYNILVARRNALADELCNLDEIISLLKKDKTINKQ